MANSSSLATSKSKVLFHLFLSISFLVLVFFYVSYRINISSIPPPPQLNNNGMFTTTTTTTIFLSSHENTVARCADVHGFKSNKDKCAYLTSDVQCLPQGYINYLHIFYCVCGSHRALGYTMLLLWLLLLFYLLGNTAAVYFCSNLEGLSKLLKLSPTIAGVTLLSLGNGAPDASSTIVSFAGTGTTGVGLNSVLGGAFFVSSVVVGIISICLDSRHIVIDKVSFMRDVCFLLGVFLAVLVILIVGKINIWGAIAFASLYIVYVLLVVSMDACKKKKKGGDDDEEEEEMCMFGSSSTVTLQKGSKPSSCQVLEAPLLCNYRDSTDAEKATILKSTNQYESFCCTLLQILELPLNLPRRLTIPDISKERWSKPFAVMSVALAPIFLAALFNSKRQAASDDEHSLLVYIIGGLIGFPLGLATLIKTKSDMPPRKFLFPWLAGGFLMSVTWSYILAQELVSLLVSIGLVLSISSSALGLTVLAWGNSLGDLIANVAVAVHGGHDGAQVAVSGCYGVPVFNILVGLGLSLVLSSWAGFPDPLVVPVDPELYQTLGFLVAGLLWALVMLPRRGMRVDSVLGYGLLCIYLCFLSLSLAQSFGLVGTQ